MSLFDRLVSPGPKRILGLDGGGFHEAAHLPTAFDLRR
jgi:hypothetical protein